MRVLLLALLACLPALASAQPAQSALPAEADVSVVGPTGPVALGAWFDVEVSGPFPSTARLVPAAGGDPDVLGRRPRVSQRGAHTVLTLPLCVARQGARAIPLQLRVGEETLDLLPVEVEVVFELPVGQAARVADMLPPLELPLPAADPWPFALAAAVGLVLIGLWAGLAGRVVEIPIPARPPDLVAIEALEELRAHLPGSPDEVQPFLVAVSDVLRTYIEGRFALHAPARTTEEFLIEVGERHDLIAAHREILEDFLTRCDLVKFARLRPERGEVAGMLGTAERFVEETRGEDEQTPDDPRTPGDDGAARPLTEAAA